VVRRRARALLRGVGWKCMPSIFNSSFSPRPEHYVPFSCAIARFSVCHEWSLAENKPRSELLYDTERLTTAPPTAGLRLWHTNHHSLESIASRPLCLQTVRQFGMFDTSSVTIRIYPSLSHSVSDSYTSPMR
jgi:hypothetical protein